MRLPVARLRRDLGQPDGGLDRLDLAEERTDAAELVMPPVLEEARRLRRHLPLVRIGQGTPRVHVAADLVDDRGRVVLLLLGRKPLAFVEYESLLCRGLALLRLRDRRDEFAPRRVSMICWWAARLVELPMPRGYSYGELRIGLVEERIGHISELDSDVPNRLARS